jgi:hypothetical protein
VIARWEGELGPPLSPDIAPLPAPSH